MQLFIVNPHSGIYSVLLISYRLTYLQLITILKYLRISFQLDLLYIFIHELYIWKVGCAHGLLLVLHLSITLAMLSETYVVPVMESKLATFKACALSTVLALQNPKILLMGIFKV